MWPYSRSGLGRRSEISPIRLAQQAHLGPNTYPKAMDLIASGALPMDRIITHRLPFSEINRALDLTASGSDSVKVTLAPGL